MSVIEMFTTAVLLLAGTGLLAAILSVVIVWWLFHKAKGTMKP
jgi:hypothetical protein